MAVLVLEGLELLEPGLPFLVLLFGPLGRPGKAEGLQLVDAFLGKGAFFLVALRGLLVVELVLLPGVVDEFSQGGIELVPNRNEEVPVGLLVVTEFFQAVLPGDAPGGGPFLGGSGFGTTGGFSFVLAIVV